MPSFSWAAACCGGAVSVPGLIVGDDAAQMTASYTFYDAAVDVDQNAIWYPKYASQTDETLKLEGAKVFYDRFQAGIMLPIVRRSLGSESSTGLGDITATVGYEFLPDWEYSPWRPRGVAFLEVVAPTGLPPDASQNIYELDARGRGFWATGAGTVLTKGFGKFDAMTSVEIHNSFSRNYSNSQTAATLKPGVGGNLGIGGGYSEKNIRVGGSILWAYEDAVASQSTDGSFSSSGSVQRSATLAVAFNYSLPQEYIVTAAYADQTIFGNPTNTTLGRSLTLSLQKHWLR